MIIAVWFGTVGIIFLVGMGLVVLTFRHWYLEAKAKGQAKGLNKGPEGQKLEDSGPQPQQSV
jgi:hypothetical protein